MIKVDGNPGDVWGYRSFGYSANPASSLYLQATVTGYPCDRSWYDMWGMTGAADAFWHPQRLKFTLDIYGCQSGSGIKSTLYHDLIVGVATHIRVGVHGSALFNFGPRLRADVFWPILYYSRHV